MAGVPIMVRPLLYNKEKLRGAASEGIPPTLAVFDALEPIFTIRMDRKEKRMETYYELYKLICGASEKLQAQLGKIAIDQGDKKPPERLERIAEKYISLSERAAQEIAAFVPEQLPAEELPITEELCEEAFRAGIAAKDFSVVFLQKQFRLKYIDACNLQDKLRQSGKITPVFLAGDVVCKA